jgi:hypothetical protein
MLQFMNRLIFLLVSTVYITLAPPRIIVVTQNTTCTTANTKMKMWRWCNPSSDNSGIFPWLGKKKNGLYIPILFEYFLHLALSIIWTQQFFSSNFIWFQYSLSVNLVATSKVKWMKINFSDSYFLPTMLRTSIRRKKPSSVDYSIIVYQIMTWTL